MSAVAPVPEDNPANGAEVSERKLDREKTITSTQAHRSAKLDKALNTSKEVESMVDNEENPEMKRIVSCTIGRIVRPAEKKRVGKELFFNYLVDQQKRERDCWQLPMVVLYFIFFSTTVLMHEDISNVSQVERNVRALMEGTSFEGITSSEGPTVSGHKSIGDIDTITDIWTYLKEAIVPWYIPDLTSTIPRNVHRTMRYNQLLGGVQIQQIRREDVSCQDEYPNAGPYKENTNINPLLAGITCYPWNRYAKKCFGGRTESDPESVKDGWCPDGPTSPPTRRRLDYLEWLPGYAGSDPRRLTDPSHADKVRGDYEKALQAGADGKGFDGGIYTITLHDYEGVAYAVDKLQSLQNENWIDTGTGWFGFKAFILNADLAVYTHLVINVFMPPSGALIPFVSLQSFPAEPYQSMTVLANDIIWGVLWLYVMMSCLFAVVVASAKGQFCNYFSNIWNWVEWGTALGGMVIMIFWIMFLNALSKVKEMSMDVVLNRPTIGAIPPFPSIYQRFDYLTSCDELHAEVAQLAGFLQIYRLWVCWYTILVMCRFFRAFKAQPRLAVVTNTLSRSFEDLAHFLVVLFVVVISYAVAGMFMFGHRILEFSMFGSSMNMCLLVMIGEGDFDEMAEEDPLTATLWFWSYTILVSMIMLNMLLAIIMDTYTDAKSDSDNEEAIWTQLRRVCEDAWRHRDFVKLSVIQDCIAKLPPRTTEVDKDLLIEIVPEITEKQAKQLIDNVEKTEEFEESKGMAISDAMKMVGWIKVSVQKLARRIEDIAEIEKDEKQMLLSNDSAIKKGDGAAPAKEEELVSFDPVTDQKMQAMDARLAYMESFLKESANHSVGKSREMRNCLSVIEDLLSSNRDFSQGAPPGPYRGMNESWDMPSGLSSRERSREPQPLGPPSNTLVFNA